MYAVMTSLQTCEPSVYNHLISQNMKPEFFAFRWITLLLSQEFQLPGNVLMFSVFPLQDYRLKMLSSQNGPLSRTCAKKSDSNQIKFDPFYLHWGCSPSTVQAARGRATQMHAKWIKLHLDSNHKGVLTTFPQCNISLEFPEMLCQNYYMSVSGISKILHCGILIDMPHVRRMFVLLHEVNPSYNKLFTFILQMY